jgi:hypothetical protein
MIIIVIAGAIVNAMILTAHAATVAIVSLKILHSLEIIFTVRLLLKDILLISLEILKRV